MSSFERKGSRRSITPSDEPVITPGAIVLTLVLVGISTLFAGVCAAYIYFIVSSADVIPAPPVLFIVNIPILLGATFYLRRAQKAFDGEPFRQHLVISAVLSITFAVLQLVGWLQFFASISLTSTQLASFLFVLSALHLLHVLAGLPFLIWFLSCTRSELQIETRPLDWWRGYLRGLCRYWRFLDVLWILLTAILWAGYGITYLK
jgi:heme/copper-type cytochrome/quinol oxidase subunit 3